MPLCEDGFDEWTFDLALDRNPTVTDSALSFCLNFAQDGKISGKVFDSNAVFLSDVTGRNQPFTLEGVDPALTLMSLDFSINLVNVTISGMKLGLAFEGRFRSFAAASLAARITDLKQ
jgi:hypothetical protein